MIISELNPQYLMREFQALDKEHKEVSQELKRLGKRLNEIYLEKKEIRIALGHPRSNTTG